MNGTHATGANPATANTPVDAGPTIAPPVSPPPHGITQQQIRPIKPSLETVGPAKPSRGQTGATTLKTPIVRNAIGQPVAPAKNFTGAQTALPALQRPGSVSPVLHGGSAASPLLSSAARVNVANTGNRGSVNGVTAIRPAGGPSGIGGPAQARYGINGTAVQNRH